MRVDPTQARERANRAACDGQFELTGVHPGLAAPPSVDELQCGGCDDLRDLARLAARPDVGELRGDGWQRRVRVGEMEHLAPVTR